MRSCAGDAGCLRVKRMSDALIDIETFVVMGFDRLAAWVEIDVGVGNWIDVAVSVGALGANGLIAFLAR